VVRINPPPLGKLLPRHAEVPVTEALADTRVVLVNGARQSGKSTLIGVVAKGRDAQWRNLDNAITRQAAIADPVGFVDSAELMVIDEVQRVPDLLLAIKEQVDAVPRPGRYLLSGSARLLGLRGLPDTLPGRTETIELWPLAQGELDGTADRFIDAVFEQGDRGDALTHESAVTRQEYAERIVRGGFPEAAARTNPRRRERFFDSYLADLVARDVSQLSDIERTAEMRALIRLLAARSGQLLVVNAVGSEVDAVLENRQGHVVGIEIKASSTVTAGDFRGLRHLAERTGDDFIAGLVFYTGTQTLPFGPRLRAVPVSALWQA